MSPAIGLAPPALAMLVGLPLVARTDTTVLGVPGVYAWIFAWIPLTSLCLWLAWALVDSKVTDEEGS